ncbi:hypothetical protein AVEN_212418-1 [Araneus ventricosus]|uniref:RNase H type-1 domain-containing protein n=1 Tax=Araneus ventricosus TaxID=182803 RepID=A0A4Y2THQ8_ARAVE|nr:hypothetical protein AVEN_212418-1 [Araneus ventricosus]
MLYKTVIESMLAYGAVVWCLDPPVRIKRKLNTIQRPFLLALTGAYRTTATSALQIILGIPPIYLQLQQEARVTAIRRLNISLPDTLTTLVPGEDEKEETGWAAHTAECPSEEQISLVDGGGITSGTRIYTDGSKTEKVDNQASVQAAANPRSINTTAREICKSLITNKHIHISWIKAQVGYEGNEEADRLAKEAAESDRDPLSIKAPISFLKSVFKKKMMEEWQSNWEDEDTGGPHLTSCQESRLNHAAGKGKKSLFFTGHGPFPSYLKRFNLATTTNCPCGNTNGTPLYYATECILPHD